MSRVIGPGSGHHLVKATGRRTRGAPQQPAGDDLGTAIVVGHVEAVEAVRRIGLEVVRCQVGVEGGAVLLHVGHLPEAADEAADVEAVGERQCAVAGS